MERPNYWIDDKIKNGFLMNNNTNSNSLSDKRNIDEEINEVKRKETTFEMSLNKSIDSKLKIQNNNKNNSSRMNNDPNINVANNFLHEEKNKVDSRIKIQNNDKKNSDRMNNDPNINVANNFINEEKNKVDSKITIQNNDKKNSSRMNNDSNINVANNFMNEENNKVNFSLNITPKKLITNTSIDASLIQKPVRNPNNLQKKMMTLTENEEKHNNVHIS